MEFDKTYSAAEILDLLKLPTECLLGSSETKVRSFAPTENNTADSLTFINQPKWIAVAEASSSNLILAAQTLRPQVEATQSKKTWIFCRNVDLSARELKQNILFQTPYRPSMPKSSHPSAAIAESAKVHPEAIIGPFAVIGENCTIGARTYVGAQTVVEENTTIGEDCTIHPQVYVGHSSQIGNRVELKPHCVIGSEGFGYAHDERGQHYRIPHTGRVILEDDVHIGAGTTIDRGTIEDTRIGIGTKIDNQCHFAHNTEIGKHGLVTGQVVVAGSTRIGDHFICGGKTAITGHIQIADQVNIAGLSGVTNNIESPGAYGGYPLLPLKEHLKVKASSTHLPQIRKDLAKVMKHLFSKD